jgi:hypothetical protein
MRTWSWLLLLSVSGCFMGNTSSTKKITDSVQDLNEQARWGRIGDAALLVEPNYRDAFVSAHQSWGNDIELADTEIVHVQIAANAEHANAIVTYSWYSKSTMTLHETTVRQHWSAHGGTYALTSEAVVKGDPSLLATATNAAGSAGYYSAD